MCFDLRTTGSTPIRQLCILYWPAACFSSHVSRLLARKKGQCIVIFVQIYRGLIKFSIYRGSPISSQIARHFFTLGLTQHERGLKRPFETLDYPIGNPSSQCGNLGFCTSSILYPVSGDLQLYFPLLGFKRHLPFDCIFRTDFSVHRRMQCFDLKTMWYPLTSTNICGTASTNVLFTSVLLRSIKRSQLLSNSFP